MRPIRAGGKRAAELADTIGSERTLAGSEEGMLGCSRWSGKVFVSKIAWIALLAVIGLLCGIGLARWQFDGKEQASYCATLQQLLEQPDDKLPRIPLDLQPNVPAGLAVEPLRLAWLTNGLTLPKEFAPTAGLFTHLLHLQGADATLRLGSTGETIHLLSVISNDEESQKYLGQPLAICVRTGVRFPTFPADPRFGTAGDEAHRDQCLACLGELGLPLTHPLRVEGLPYCLRDVLRDSLANFDLQQRELEWTGLAYALYLPPLRQWKNRFGETFSFDDLTTELLERSLLHSACGGTHRLILLTVLCRADAKHSILSEQVRRRLREFLMTAVKLAVATQRPDGTWPITWIRGLIPDNHPQN